MKLLGLILLFVLFWNKWLFAKVIDLSIEYNGAEPNYVIEVQNSGETRKYERRKKIRDNIEVKDGSSITVVVKGRTKERLDGELVIKVDDIEYFKGILVNDKVKETVGKFAPLCPGCPRNVLPAAPNVPELEDKEKIILKYKINLSDNSVFPVLNFLNEVIIDEVSFKGDMNFKIKGDKDELFFNGYATSLKKTKIKFMIVSDSKLEVELRNAFGQEDIILTDFKILLGNSVIEVAGVKEVGETKIIGAILLENKKGKGMIVDSGDEVEFKFSDIGSYEVKALANNRLYYYSPSGWNERPFLYNEIFPFSYKVKKPKSPWYYGKVRYMINTDGGDVVIGPYSSNVNKTIANEIIWDYNGFIENEFRDVEHINAGDCAYTVIMPYLVYRNGVIKLVSGYKVDRGFNCGYEIEYRYEGEEVMNRALQVERGAFTVYESEVDIKDGKNLEYKVKINGIKKMYRYSIKNIDIGEITGYISGVKKTGSGVQFGGRVYNANNLKVMVKIDKNKDGAIDEVVTLSSGDIRKSGNIYIFESKEVNLGTSFRYWIEVDVGNREYVEIGHVGIGLCYDDSMKGNRIKFEINGDIETGVKYLVNSVDTCGLHFGFVKNGIPYYISKDGISNSEVKFNDVKLFEYVIDGISIDNRDVFYPFIKGDYVLFMYCKGSKGIEGYRVMKMGY